MDGACVIPNNECMNRDDTPGLGQFVVCGVVQLVWLTAAVEAGPAIQAPAGLIKGKVANTQPGLCTQGGCRVAAVVGMDSLKGLMSFARETIGVVCAFADA